jgi:hypothetical protein
MDPASILHLRGAARMVSARPRCGKPADDRHTMRVTPVRPIEGPPRGGRRAIVGIPTVGRGRLAIHHAVGIVGLAIHHGTPGWRRGLEPHCLSERLVVRASRLKGLAPICPNTLFQTRNLDYLSISSFYGIL